MGAALVVGCATEDPAQAHQYGQQTGELAAYCTANVIGKGNKAVETDYLPRVIRCENGSAPLEALKAQAVAARSYLYYKLNSSGSVADGQSDQVYTCSAQPSAIHYQAVNETAGQVLRYKNTQIAAFYVAGSVPTAASCVAKAGDNDYSNTEKYVTYNWGKSGTGLTQTSLGWINSGNYANRGCKSQNGASCLAKAGWGYADILKFYYGSDIEFVTATGSCVQSCECSGSQGQTEGCGNCGSRSRTCNGCTWGAWSGCGGQGACAPGATSSQGCGNCGTQSRTCTAQCGWGTFGSCSGVGPCASGAQESEACGQCGTRTRTCSGSCGWSGWSGCGGEGECAPGDVDHRACGECGVELRSCSDACGWSAYGFCTSVDPASPDAAPLPCNAGPAGICGAGVLRCLSGQVACVAEGTATLEECNDLDDDCDGLTDEDGAPLGATPPPLAAEQAGLSADDVADAGSEVAVSLSFRNVGSLAWEPGALRLVAEDAANGAAAQTWHESWLSSAVVANSDVAVAPGDILRFDLTARAPSTGSAGTRFRLVHTLGVVRCPDANVVWTLAVTPADGGDGGPGGSGDALSGPSSDAASSGDTGGNSGGNTGGDFGDVGRTPVPPVDRGGCHAAAGRSNLALPLLLVAALLWRRRGRRLSR